MTEAVTLPSMEGIPSELTSTIPDAWQVQLAKAIPECRVVWNNHVERFQVIYREPLNAQQIDGTHLRGWVIIATFDPQESIDGIIRFLRKREEFVAWKLEQMGYHGDTTEDVIESYLDDAENVIQRASDQLHDDVCDDYFHGAAARARDENAIWKKTVERELDQTKRSTAHTKLVVPVKRSTEVLLP